MIVALGAAAADVAGREASTGEFGEDVGTQVLQGAGIVGLRGPDAARRPVESRVERK